MKKTNKLQHRRERRKATINPDKAQKQKPGAVAHGATGSVRLQAPLVRKRSRRVGSQSVLWLLPKCQYRTASKKLIAETVGYKPTVVTLADCWEHPL